MHRSATGASRRKLVLISAALTFLAASSCQSASPAPWESEMPGASAAEYLEALPYDFWPGEDICPTEAQLRETIPNMPAIERTEIEVHTDALDTAVAVYDNGNTESDSLREVGSGVECFFWIDEATVDYLKVGFGIYPFQEGADEWYAEIAGEQEYTAPEWDRASYQFFDNSGDPHAEDAFDGVVIAGISGQVVAYFWGKVPNGTMAQDETVAALFELATVNADSLWER